MQTFTWRNTTDQSYLLELPSLRNLGNENDQQYISMIKIVMALILMIMALVATDWTETLTCKLREWAEGQWPTPPPSSGTPDDYHHHHHHHHHHYRLLHSLPIEQDSLCAEHQDHADGCDTRDDIIDMNSMLWYNVRPCQNQIHEADCSNAGDVKFCIRSYKLLHPLKKDLSSSWNLKFLVILLAFELLGSWEIVIGYVGTHCFTWPTISVFAYYNWFELSWHLCGLTFCSY